MTKQFTLLQLFSLVDGRLTTMDDVYNALEHICNMPGIMTHHLPTAWSYVKNQEKPQWIGEVTNKLEAVRKAAGTDEFEPLVTYIEKYDNPTFDIPQITNMVAFGQYMGDNSLLLKIGSKKG